MSTIEQRIQGNAQGWIQKQAKTWYEDWSQNWIVWLIALMIVLVIMWWLLEGKEFPHFTDICDLPEDEPEELEELTCVDPDQEPTSEPDISIDDIAKISGSEVDQIRIDPVTGVITTGPEPVKEPKARRFGSKGERITCETLEAIYKLPFPTVRPNFLKNPETKRNLELDCYNEQLKIAAEYNGEQHYNFPNRFHKTRQEFMKQVRRDRLKAEICELRGIHLITIPWTINHQQIPIYIKERLPNNSKLTFLE